MNPLKIVFAGTPEFGIPCLEAIASHHSLSAVYTQPDRPSGRGRRLTASLVKEWAEHHHYPIYQPENFKNEEAILELKALKPDLIVVIAYGLILPEAVLNLPRYGSVNVHASLLPRWRGASPIQQAILKGDEETGITIMQMDKGLDTGAILAYEKCKIGRDNAGTLQIRLSKLAVQPLLKTLDMITSGTLNPKAQDESSATYAPKIHKEDAKINWHQSAMAIDRQIRAYNPWPMAFFEINEMNVRVHAAKNISEQHTKVPGTILSIQKEGIKIATGEEVILIECLQFPGSRAISVAEWLNGQHDQLQLNSILP